jgi:hypothetical protein
LSTANTHDAQLQSDPPPIASRGGIQPAAGPPPLDGRAVAGVAVGEPALEVRSGATPIS